MQNFFALTAERQARERVQVLQRAAHAVNAGLNLDRTLGLLLEQLGSLVPFDVASVFLLQADELYRVAVQSHSSPQEERHFSFYWRDNPLAREIFTRRCPLLLANAQQDHRFRTWPGYEHAQSWIGVPLAIGDELLGCLTVGSRQVNAYSEADARLAMGLAEQTAVAVQSARLYQTLCDSAEVYRTVPEASLEMIFVLDAEGKIEYGNPRIEAITGHRPADWIGRPFASLVVPEDLSTARKMFQDAKSGHASRHEICFYDAQRQILVIDLRLVPCLREEQVTGAIGFGNDITALKRTAKLGQQRELEQAGLHAITAAISSTLELGETLNLALETALAVTEASTGAIYLWDETHQVLRLAVHRNLDPEFVRCAETFRLGEGLTGRAAQGRIPLILGEMLQPTLSRKKGIEREGPFRRVSIPLWTRNCLMGVLNLYARQPANRFSEMSDWLAAVGDQIAIAIENARLYEAALADSRRDALLCRLSMNLGRSLELDEILDQTMIDLGELTVADRTYFVTVDPDAETWKMTHEHVSPYIEPDIGRSGTFEDIRARADLILAGQSIVVDDVEADLQGATSCALCRSLGIKSFLLVPIMVKGRLYGALGFDYCWEKHHWQPDEVELLESVARQLSLALENALLYAQARASETRYRTLIETASALGEGIAILQSEGQQENICRFINQTFAQLLGYTPKELIGTNLLEVVHPNDWYRVLQSYDARKAGDETPTHYEITYRTRGGRAISAEVSAAVTEYEGQPANIIFVRDVSERKQLEQQLLQAQKMEAVGTLAGGIAHDFNNLLVGILGYASLLQRELPADSSLQADVETIVHSARRAADLTSQLLALTRHDHLEVRPLSLNEVVTEVARLLSRTLDKAIVIETCLSDDLDTIEGDAGQLHQMLLNLALNAGEAMPQGGRLVIETTNMTLSAEQARVDLNLEPGRYACLSVTDTGHGMDEETLARIFEPFFTTKEQGGGLGLAMVYSITKAHEGAIHVYSEPSVGSTFKVYLPTTANSVSDVPSGECQAVGGTETVLVVDDEEPVRRLLQRVLEGSGYTVLLAQDGCQAVDLYRQRSDEIGLVILDMIMPQMGGQEAFNRLQEISPQVKVLLSSGYSARGRAEEILCTGIHGFLQKPYDAQLVLHKVRAVLDGQELSRA